MKKDRVKYQYDSVEFRRDSMVIIDGEEASLSKNQVQELLPALIKWANGDSKISGEYYFEEN